MFPNIPIDFTINKIKEQWPIIKTKTNIPEALFFKILNFCLLDSNYFIYNGKYYKQIDGCPMGSPISPCIANFILNLLLDDIISKLDFTPKLIKKYVDDLIIICPKNATTNIHQIFNKFHPKIQFTVELEINRRMPYLDLMIIRNSNNTITTDYFSKPTSSGRILNYLSAHPRHVKINTAYNFISRVLTLSDPIFHTKNQNYIYKILLTNNYPKNNIDKLLKKYYIIRNQQNSNNSNMNNSNIEEQTKIYKSLAYIPGISEKLAKLLKSENLNIAHVPQNKLRNIIFNNMKDETKTLEKSSVIYKIPCNGDDNNPCDKCYIGQTKNYLRVRISQHKSDLRNPPRNDITALVAHFSDEGHTPNFENVEILDIEQNYWKRCTLESLHICTQNSYNFRRDTRNISPIYSDLLQNYNRSIT